MDAMLHAAEAALRSSPSPALALSQLVAEVHAVTGRGAPDAMELLEALRRHPERFKILDPGRGPWRFLARGSTSTTDEPWVVSLGDPEAPSEGHLADRLERRLRESIRRVAVELDEDSPREVFRWRAMALAGASLARLLRGKAA
ncbi:MAG TPA: hypothetical protein VLA36_07765 [Longimicrobiales bacterium]|nr:hypothetical protein [Longimicrobiales bacterium]